MLALLGKAVDPQLGLAVGNELSRRDRVTQDRVVGAEVEMSLVDFDAGAVVVAELCALVRAAVSVVVPKRDDAARVLFG